MLVDDIGVYCSLTGAVSSSVKWKKLRLYESSEMIYLGKYLSGSVVWLFFISVCEMIYF